MKGTMVFSWIVFTLMAPLIASGKSENKYCVDLVFVLQTSCNVNDDLVLGAKNFILGVAGLMSADKNSTMALITYDEFAKEVVSPQMPATFVTSLKEIPRGDNCPNNFMAKTADALNLVDTNNYFSEQSKRGKVVVVLSDGISFDMKSNMKTTLAMTKDAIGKLERKGVKFATFKFYDHIKWNGDDRKGDEEYDLYKPVLEMNFFSDFTQSFVDKLSTMSDAEFECPHADEPKEVCSVPTLDLIYVIDRSNSIKEDDIITVKKFLVKLSKKIMAKSNDTWIGALSYNHDVIHELNLQKNEVQREIEGIVKDNSLNTTFIALEDIPTTTGMGTYSHKALKEARESMNYLNNQHNRQDAGNLIIMLTDGVTNIEPYLKKNPKAQDKYSYLTVGEAGTLKSGKTDLIIVGLPNRPAMDAINDGNKALGLAKIKAGENEWRKMIENRYPGDNDKLETNLFLLEKMEELEEKFDTILETVCTMSSV